MFVMLCCFDGAISHQNEFDLSNVYQVSLLTCKWLFGGIENIEVYLFFFKIFYCGGGLY